MSARKLLLLFGLIIQGCHPLAKQELSSITPLPELHGAEFNRLYTNNKTNTALVLGGGGVRGAAHLGVLSEFKQAGIRPDVIIGTSSGALAAAFYSAHHVNKPTHISLEKQFFTLVNENDLKNLLSNDFSQSRFALLPSHKLRKLLTDLFGNLTFEDLEIPLILIATNLETGEKYEFHQGPLVPALLASMAYPGFLEPVEIQGQYFIDGGVVDNLAVATAKKLKPPLIIAVDLSENLEPSLPTNFVGVGIRASKIHWLNKIAESRKQADIVISVESTDIATFDTSKLEETFARGQAAARQALPTIKEKIKFYNFN